MLTKEKQKEIRKQFREILEKTHCDWINMSEKLEISEMMPSEYRELGNWMLVRAIIDYWCLTRPYAPPNQKTSEEFSSLSPFLT